jgi:enamine deaminase RidA (YjgF/YER057c/UK114 family)
MDINIKNKILISSGTEWEEKFGYSRAVRAGNIIEVAGTTAVQDDKIVGEGDIYAQTKYIFRKIEQALMQAGGSLNDVVRTRMYTTDISKWESISKAHGEIFKDIRPASTLIEVKALIRPELLIEIEATAIIND